MAECQSSHERKHMFCKRLVIMLLFCAAISLYICCLITSINSPPYEFSSSIIDGFVRFGRNGFPTSPFVIIFLILGLISAALLYTMMPSDRMDKLGRNFSHSERQPYGDAHFEEPSEYKETAKIRRIENARGKIVGQLTKDGSRCIDLDPDTAQINLNVFVTGAPGSGKTYGFVKTEFLQALKRRNSIVLSDPDGGLYADTSEYAKAHGYVVRYLNLADITRSDGWDCMKYLPGPNMITNAQIFAETVITNIVADPDNIYGTGPKSLLTALLLRVLLGHDYPRERRNIKSVYQLLQNPAGLEHLDKVFDPANLTPDEMPCLGPYLAFKQSSKNLAGNLLTNLAIGLQTLQNPDVADVLSTDDIDIMLPGLQPCVYYCRFPDNHDTFKFIVTLFFSTMFQVLIDHADSRSERHLPVPVEFLLDEFPSCGIFPNWARKLSTVRKRWISIVMITQDMNQLRNNYKDTWATILNNCATTIALGINEMETAKWFQARIGETSIDVTTDSRALTYGMFSKPADRESAGVGKRYLLSVNELFQIPSNRALIIFQRHGPIYAYTVPHTLFPTAHELGEPIDPMTAPLFRDRDLRRRLMEEEQMRLEAYAEEHGSLTAMDEYSEGKADDEDVENGDVLTVRNLISGVRRWTTCTFADIRKQKHVSTKAASSGDDATSCPIGSELGAEDFLNDMMLGIDRVETQNHASTFDIAFIDEQPELELDAQGDAVIHSECSEVAIPDSAPVSQRPRQPATAASSFAGFFTKDEDEISTKPPKPDKQSISRTPGSVANDHGTQRREGVAPPKLVRRQGTVPIRRKPEKDTAE